METKSQDQIVNELHQLCAQYLQEVPSRRRTWPKSIKERVLQLRQLELSCDEISKLTGIPTATLYCWKMPTPKSFLPVKIVRKNVPSELSPLVPKSKRGRPRSTPTIIVIAPNGVRLEGLDLKGALVVAREMGSWT